MAIQADGKIVAVGGDGEPRRSTGDFALARYNPNGSLDTSFSGDGKQTTDFGDVDAGERGGAPGRRQDRRGRRTAARRRDFALARYNPNGSLDTSFSGDGKQTTDFGGFDGANGVALQGDGKIVAVGAAAAPRDDFALARYNPNGSLDTSFSGDGKQTTDFGGVDGASGVALQGDGKIVAVGARAGVAATTSRSPATTRTARSTRASPATASRRPTSGASTGRTGWRSRATARSSRSAAPATSATPATSRSPATTRTARSTRASPATASRRPTSGASTRRTGWRSRRTARSSRSAQAAAPRDFALARYNPNGSLDPSFSGDGKQTTDFGGIDEANGVALQADGKIVAVGDAAAAPTTTSRSPATTRTARSTRASPATASRRPTSGAATRRAGWRSRRDGKIVAVGCGAAAPRRLRARPLQPQRLARHELLRRRQADDRLRRRLRRGERGGAPGRRQDRRGRLRGASGAGDDFALARYNPNGSLDTSFSGDGKQTTDFGGSDGATGWRSRRDGKIVAVGSGGGHDGDFALARYNPNGSLDTSFSGDGKQTTDFGGHDEANGVALQGDGKIVAVGGGFGTASDFALARYLGLSPRVGPGYLERSPAVSDGRGWFRVSPEGERVRNQPRRPSGMGAAGFEPATSRV